MATNELLITRVFDAPRELVWKAWTEPEQMAKWWGPHNFTNPVCEMDVRPGGSILIHMQGPEGPAMPMHGVFHEVVQPEKLVFTTSALHDENGNPGIETMNTVTFTEQNGRTTLKLESRFTKTKPEFAFAVSGHKAGWNQSLDRLLALVTHSPEFVITRVFDAPRDLIWKVYTESEHLAKWWGPKGLKMLDVKLDFRPGGIFHYGMETPDGHKMWGKFVYREIDAPERVSFVVSFSDEQGGVTRHPMSATWPLEVLSIVTFFEIAPGKTALIMSGMPVNATVEERETFAAGRDSMQQGFKGTLDQLEEYLRNLSNEENTADREFSNTRVFNAPPELVWKAWADPDHLKQWWGPKGFTNTFHEFDFQPGGMWRFVMHGPDGTDYPNQSVFVEVTKPERIVLDHIVAPKFRATVVFEDLGGKTRITWRMLFETAAVFDKVKGYAVEGNRQNLDRLELHLTTLT